MHTVRFEIVCWDDALHSTLRGKYRVPSMRYAKLLKNMHPELRRVQCTGWDINNQTLICEIQMTRQEADAFYYKHGEGDPLVICKDVWAVRWKFPVAA